METEIKSNFFTPERALYAVLYYLIVTGFVANVFAGNAVYKEYQRPGSAIMVGDLSNVEAPKGRK